MRTKVLSFSFGGVEVDRLQSSVGANCPLHFVEIEPTSYLGHHPQLRSELSFFRHRKNDCGPERRGYAVLELPVLGDVPVCRVPVPIVADLNPRFPIQDGIELVIRCSFPCVTAADPKLRKARGCVS